MLVPRFVHGLTRDVKKESLRRIRLMRKGARWSEAMADELVDVATLPGLVVLDGPYPNVGFEPHTHIYSPFHWADDAIWSVRPTLPMSALSGIFFDAVQTPWGVLGMLDDSTGTWMRLEEHHWPYIQAVERRWDELEAIGDRYSGGSQSPSPLWHFGSAPYYALCALGLSREDLHALMPQGFHALYRRLLEVRAAQGLPPPPEEAP
ncbi:MAG: hypothetical protein IPO67_30040 [Deltaproteobacteria bacterium]|nr:hypothetical protein [Deltaproteobacteria bacterium]